MNGSFQNEYQATPHHPWLRTFSGHGILHNISHNFYYLFLKIKRMWNSQSSAVFIVIHENIIFPRAPLTWMIYAVIFVFITLWSIYESIFCRYASQTIKISTIVLLIVLAKCIDCLNLLAWKVCDTLFWHILMLMCWYVSWARSDDMTFMSQSARSNIKSEQSHCLTSFKWLYLENV